MDTSMDIILVPYCWFYILKRINWLAGYRRDGMGYIGTRPGKHTNSDMENCHLVRGFTH